MSIETLNEFNQLFMMFKTPKRFNQQKNSITFLNLFVRFENIFLDLFEWKGLPETCDIEYLEKSLFWTGRGIICNDKDYGWLSLRANESMNRNIYNRALRWRAIGYNGYNKEYKLDNLGLWGDDAVLVRNNKLRYPTAMAIMEYIFDIADVKRAMMTNVNATKTPTIMYGEEREMKTLKNAYKQLSDNEPVIFLDNEMKGAFDIKDNTKTYVADKLIALKHDLLSELLSLYGIKYVNTEKKERLITDEANCTDMFMDISVKTMLETRQEACRNLSKLLGREVTCALKYDYKDYETKISEAFNSDDKEENDNE